MPHQLQVINGGLHKSLEFKGIKIISAPRKSPPIDVDALVFEEDSFLIMSDEPEYPPLETHPIRLIHEIENFEPKRPGKVVVKGADPLRMLAVVHDVNRAPTWKEEWIEQAMVEVFQKTELLKIKTLGLPILGSKHGDLTPDRFSVILARVLKSIEFTSLKLIWLIVPVPANAAVIAMLEKRLITPAGSVT